MALLNWVHCPSRRQIGVHLGSIGPKRGTELTVERVCRDRIALDGMSWCRLVIELPYKTGDDWIATVLAFKIAAVAQNSVGACKCVVALLRARPVYGIHLLVEKIFCN